MTRVKLKCPNPKCKATLNLNFKAIPQKEVLVKCPKCSSKIRFKSKQPASQFALDKEPQTSAILMIESNGHKIEIMIKNGLNSFGRVTDIEGRPTPQNDLNFLKDRHITRGIHFSIETKVNRIGQLEYILFDGGSKNGTYINSKDYRLSSEDREVLKANDIILFGKSKAQFLITTQNIRRTVPPSSHSSPSNDVTEII